MTIRDRMLDREPSITRLVDRLEKRGLVRRNPSKDDRRRVECHLTPAGLTLLDETDEVVDQRDQELMGRLTAPELNTLTRLLDKVGDPE